MPVAYSRFWFVKSNASQKDINQKILGGSLKCVEMLIDSLNSLTKEFTIEFPNHKVESDWTASYEAEAHSGVMLKITGTPFECAKSITQTQYSIDFEGNQFNAKSHEPYVNHNNDS